MLQLLIIKHIMKIITVINKKNHYIQKLFSIIILHFRQLKMIMIMMKKILFFKFSNYQRIKIIKLIKYLFI